MKRKNTLPFIILSVIPLPLILISSYFIQLMVNYDLDHPVANTASRDRLMWQMGAVALVIGGIGLILLLGLPLWITLLLRGNKFNQEQSLAEAAPKKQGSKPRQLKKMK